MVKLQYSCLENPVDRGAWWAAVHGVSALVVKNLPANAGDTLGRENPPEEKMATHSSILAWRPHGQRSLASYSLWGCKE